MDCFITYRWRQCFFFFFKQKTAYEMRISDWSSDVCSSDLLDSRGVPARYTTERIGFRSEILSNIVIGDPKRPDLTATRVEVLLGYGWSGPYVSGINAAGVRLYGRFVDGRLSFGLLDKVRHPESKAPFALPALSGALREIGKAT